MQTNAFITNPSLPEFSWLVIPIYAGFDLDAGTAPHLARWSIFQIVNGSWQNAPHLIAESTEMAARFLKLREMTHPHAFFLALPTGIPRTTREWTLARILTETLQEAYSLPSALPCPLNYVINPEPMDCEELASSIADHILNDVRDLDAPGVRSDDLDQHELAEMMKLLRLPLDH